LVCDVPSLWEKQAVKIASPSVVFVG